MKTIKYIAGALIAILLIITTVVLFNTLKSVPTYESTKKIDIKSIDHQGAVNRFAKSLMFKTIANYDDFPKSEYKRFHRFLENSFPLVHSTLKKEIVGGYSLLYTWKGTDSSKKPILFMGHQDVVPIAPGTLGLWTHPPFDGKAVDGFIWGRGAIDNKSGVMGIFEAVETLISDGFTPKQTIYLSFGHDEEIGGNEGAAKTVELLKSRGVKLDYVLDEGGIITNGMFPGIDDPVAVIGIEEKGYISIELIVEGKGGHSSMPPKQTTVGILSNAITKLESNPFKPRLDGAAKKMFKKLTPHMPFYERMGLANLWIFECFALNRITKSQSANAMVRTTTAPTMLQGSNKENVLAAKAKAVVNFRVLPGDTTETVIKRVTKVIDDKRVIINPGTLQINPSPISDINTSFYKVLEKSIRQHTEGNVITAPYLVVGATDSRHFIPLTKNIYKFIGITLSSSDLKGFHGTNEKLSADEYIRAVKIYYQIIKNINK